MAKGFPERNNNWDEAGAVLIVTFMNVTLDILFDEISTSNYLQIAFIFGVQTL